MNLPRWNSSRDDVTEAIEEFEKSSPDIFFEESIQLIRDKLAQETQYRSPYRSPYLRTLYDQLEELTLLNSLYISQHKHPLTNQTHQEIGNKFRVIKNQIQEGVELTSIREDIETMIDEELLLLEDTINPFSQKSVRDIVESHINFQGTFGESYVENDATEKFFQYFTIEYINLVGKEQSLSASFLQCTKEDIITIISIIKEKLSSKDRDALQYVMDFQIDSGENVSIDFSIDDTGNTLKSALDEVKTETVEEETIQTMSWAKLEGEKGFQRDKNHGMTLAGALNSLGFPDTLKDKMNVIFGKELTEKQQTLVKKFVQFFLVIESSGGYNVENYAGASSASAYFQYLTGNGKRVVEEYRDGKWYRFRGDIHSAKGKKLRTSRWKSSYDRALSAIPFELKEKDSELMKEYNNIGSPKKQSITKLSAENQIVLFLCDIYKRKRGKTMMKKFLGGNVEAVKDIYTKIHHTNVDQGTKKLMNSSFRLIFSDNKQGHV